MQLKKSWVYSMNRMSGPASLFLHSATRAAYSTFIRRVVHVHVIVCNKSGAVVSLLLKKLKSKVVYASVCVLAKDLVWPRPPIKLVRPCRGDSWLLVFSHSRTAAQIAHVSAVVFPSPAVLIPLFIKFSLSAAVRDSDEAPTSSTSFVETRPSSARRRESSR